MALLYGAKYISQSAVANRPHILGFQTARSTAHDTLFEIWNAATNAGIKAAVDKDGKYYSAALTAGDILYAVTGGVANVLRLDSLAIGAAGKILRSDGSVPAWTTVTIPDTAAQGDILHASAANVWSSLAKGTARQVLQINAGATLPEWSSDLSISALSITTLAASGLISANAGLTVASGQTLTLTGATVAGAPTWSTTQTLNTTGNAATATNTTGNAATATALATARTINGVSFDGTANITVTAAAGTLSGATLAAGVTASSLTSVGTIATGVWQGTAIANAYVANLPASQITAGTFGAGDYVFPSDVTVTDYIQGTTGNGYVDIRGDSGATVDLRFTDGGILFLGDTANSKMTQGLTIMGHNSSTEHFAIKRSSVAHGMTDLAETDTYLQVRAAGSPGGVSFAGYGATGLNVGIAMYSYIDQEDNRRTNAASGHFHLLANIKSGTGSTTPSADQNLFVVGAASTARFILDSDGDSHQDVGTAWTNFDEHDDVALLNRLTAHVTRRDDPLRRGFSGWLSENRDDLERMKLVQFNSDGHHFVNMSRLAMLLVGAVRQLGDRYAALERRLPAGA